MSCRVFDDGVLGRYLTDRLTSEEAEAFEAHAADCPVCGPALEEALQPTAGRLQDLFRTEPVPESLKVALLRPPRSAWPAWSTAGVALAAVSLGILVWLRRAQVDLPVLAASQGTAWEGSHPLKAGGAVNERRLVTVQGTTSFSLRGVRMQAGPDVTQFTCEREGQQVRITVTMGTVRFVNEPDHVGYSVVAGGQTYRPLGTRFQVRALSGQVSSVDVYEGVVERQGTGPIALVKLGQSLGDTLFTEVTEDPTAFMRGRPLLLPDPSTGALEQALPSQSSEGVDSLDLTRVVAEPRSADAWFDLARRSVDSSEFEDALTMARRGLQCDLTGLRTEPETLRKLARVALESEEGRAAAAQLLSLLPKGPDRTALERQLAASSVGKVPEKNDADAKFAAAQALPAWSDWDELMTCRALFAAAEDGRNNEYKGGAHDFTAEFRQVRTRVESLTQRPLRVRDLARTYHLLGEAAYYLQDRPACNDFTRKAIQLWRRPHWQVHLATRICETQPPDRQEVLALLRNGLVQDPSWYTYSRTITAYGILADNPQTRAAYRRLVDWAAETYAAIPAARLLRADILAEEYREWDEVVRAIQDVRREFGLDSVSTPRVARLATGLWHLGDKAGALDLMRSIGSGADRRLWASFHASTNDLAAALMDYQAIPTDLWTSGDRLAQANLLRRLRRDREAVEPLREVIAGAAEAMTRSNQSQLAADVLAARIELAEILRESDPQTSLTLARRARSELSILGGLGSNRVWLRPWYQSRLDRLIGHRDAAYGALERLLGSAPPYPYRQWYVERLRQWHGD